MRRTEEPSAGAGITQATTKWRASTTLAGIIQRTASPLGTIIMMATSTAVMASTLAARMCLARRNTRARSPLQSRELDRYFETRKRVNYIGDCSAGGTSDFRYYNYRRVPYFGGSDNYQYMKQKPAGWARRL